MKSLILLLGILWLVTAHTEPLSKPAVARPAYNEAYDSAGQLRPAYRDFKINTGIDPLKPSPQFAQKMMNAPLNDSITIFPVPLILTPSELASIEDGVNQRANIYVHLFHDLVMGDQMILHHPDGLPRELVESIFLAEGASLDFYRKMYKGKSLDFIRFMYGPDLIRNSFGTWQVIEDNIGASIGGTADVDHIRETYYQEHKLVDPQTSFILEAVHGFREDLEHTDDADSISLNASRELSIELKDQESDRTQDYLKILGVEHWSGISEEHFKMIENGEFASFINHFNFYQKDRNFVRLAKAASEDKVELFVTLGTEVLGNKLLLPYMEDLSRIYLGEDLKLSSPPTHLAYARELGDNADSVIKLGDGMQGSDVHVLKNMTPDRVHLLRRRMADEEAASELRSGVPFPTYVEQERVDLSVLPMGPGLEFLNATIDIRPLAYVGPKRITHSHQPWGRANAKILGRLNNVIQGAMELVVIASDCEAMLKPGRLKTLGNRLRSIRLR